LDWRRIKISEAPELLALVELGSQTLHASVPRVYAGDGNLQPEWLSNGGFWIPRSVLDESSWLSQRFWAGHVVGTNAFPLAASALAEPGEIAEVLNEIVRLQQGGSPYGDELSKSLSSSRVSGARETVMDLLDEHPDLIERSEVESWCTVPIAVADRVGLLFSGDVRASIDALLTLEDEHRKRSRAERVVGEPRTRGLLEYALSYAYQEIRYLSGLAGKPKVL